MAAFFGGNSDISKTQPVMDQGYMPEGQMGTGQMGSGQMGSGMANYGETQPISPMGGNGAPMNGIYGNGLSETVPVGETSFNNFDGMQGSGIQDYGTTKAHDFGNVSSTGGSMPVTGWLVCIDGPDKGKDYRIHNGNNRIGRDREMDICIENDELISRQCDSNVVYDDAGRKFYFGPMMGTNIVRVNGNAVINKVELNANDILTIGSTKLMFVPLCGERFDWNE